MAEFLLYGRTDYNDVLEFTASLREAGEKQGSPRAIAFATTVAGEAHLLAGDLSDAAAALEEGILLHRRIGANAGESLSLQRLAEVHLELGDRERAQQLLEEALPLARWSLLSHHLVQRIFGTMIRVADDPQSALAVVRRAEQAIGPSDMCRFCTVTIAVPAAIACAQAGDLEWAHVHLMMAESSCESWPGTAWRGAVAEARAHVAVAERRPDDAAALFDEAAKLFDQAGQPLDVARCRAGVPERVLATVLFSDLVDSTERAAAVGDADWRELLDRHDAVVRGAIARSGGRVIKQTGDGFLATFESPAQAIRCGQGIIGDLEAVELAARVGIHTGEVEVRGDDIGGIAVHIAARIAGAADSGRVAVSHSVPPLVTGSDHRFVSDGPRRLKGIDGEWDIFLVEDSVAAV